MAWISEFYYGEVPDPRRLNVVAPRGLMYARRIMIDRDSMNGSVQRTRAARRLVLSRETIRRLATQVITNSAVGCPPSIGCPRTTLCPLTQVNCSKVCPTPNTDDGGGGDGTGTGPTHSGTALTDCACTVQTL